MGNRHALCITAYNEIESLIYILKKYSRYFDCFVHIDKKTKLTDFQKSELNSISHVFIFQKYKVNWGSINHVKAFLYLMEMAVKNHCRYFHLISANTLIVKNPLKVIDFFDENNDKIFMRYVKRNAPDLSEYENFMFFDYRLKPYYFQHIYNLRSSIRIIRGITVCFEKFFSKLQFTFKINKKCRFPINYKGYIYCHFNFEYANYVLKFVKENKAYINFLKYCFVGEEFFFQNIFLNNSDYAPKVVNDCQIFDVWSETRGYPAELNINDYDSIKNSKKMFARKITNAVPVTGGGIAEKIFTLEKF